MKKGPAKARITSRKRKHGFLARAASHGGRKVLKRRRTEGREKLTV